MTKTFSLTEGRRPAGYMRASPSDPDALFDEPGEFVSIDIVNTIRPLVRKWRDQGYPNATAATRALLEFWQDSTVREYPFFYCQLEAIETLIWLIESPPASRTGLSIIGDGGPFDRLCSKMATGSGKTLVMAMLIAWNVLNKVDRPQDTRFTKHILVMAPGLTVKSRLAVLDPIAPGNAYEEFRVVPNNRLSQLRQGRVKVLNWHSLAPIDPAKGPRVMKLGAEKDTAFARRCLGELSTAPRLLVINDEAHHAWRNAAMANFGKTEREKATVWIQGLDRISRAVRILRCHDFSATPFVAGKANASETLFPWIVSDFSLTDAIESGLVKTPRIVIRDDAGRHASTGRSRFSHIYADPDVKADLSRKGTPLDAGLPPLVTMAYIALGSDWTRTAETWQASSAPTKPVLISVANSIETSARIEHAFQSGQVPIPELCEPSAILRIDSKVLERAEDAEIGVSDVTESDESANGDEDTHTEGSRRTATQQYELLRRQVDTIGKIGEPGARFHNVISVSMLSEGWDARTVTHIMGLRAFTSQLLCEQVVGRGLRRTNYETDDEGLLLPEYVNVFGVPFSFLPVEGTPLSSASAAPSTAVFVDPAKEKYRIQWPRINAVVTRFTEALSLDFDSLADLVLDGSSVTLALDLGEPIDGRVDISRLSRLDLDAWSRRFRLQPVLFNIARRLFQRMPREWCAGREYLVGDVITLVERFIASGKVRIEPEICAADPIRRRLTLTVRARTMLEYLWDAFRLQNVSKQEIRLEDDPIGSTSDMRLWYTRRPTCASIHSHLNVCVYDKSWEHQAALNIDACSSVDAWVKNDHLDFEIPYVFDGVARRYRPDFLIRFNSGTTMILEIKGMRTLESDAKHRNLEEWVRAVNQDGRFGMWTSAVAYDPSDVGQIIASATRS